MSTKNGVWHDAKLDPPGEAGKYLVAGSSGSVYTAHWYPAGGNNKWQGHWGSGYRRPAPLGPVITHWMPLPKHPMYIKDRNGKAQGG